MAISFLMLDDELGLAIPSITGFSISSWRVYFYSSGNKGTTPLTIDGRPYEITHFDGRAIALALSAADTWPVVTVDEFIQLYKKHTTDA